MGFLEFFGVSGVGFLNLKLGFVGIFCVCEPGCVGLMVWVTEIGLVWPWAFELV